MQLVQTPPIKTTAVNTLLVGYEDNCISGFCAARHKRDRTTWKLNIEKVIRIKIWVNTQPFKSVMLSNIDWMFVGK